MTGLQTRSLAVRRGGRTLLAELDLTAAPGEILGLLGPNGAGKTSLLRILAGIDQPAAGSVSFEGEGLDRMRPRDRARRIAVLPQPPEAAWPITVERLVWLGRMPFARPFGRYLPADRQAVEDAIADADLADLRERPITSLSAGEAARAFLARALAGRPRLLLADEPTANLDPAHQIAAMRLLRRLAQGGATIIMAQHDLPLASRFCDRVLLIGGGRAIALGKPEDALVPANLATAFGIAAYYPDKGDEDFFALPWSLVAKPSSDDIIPS